MKSFRAVRLLIIAAVLLSGNTGFKTVETFEPVAVIELFTSQGCSSCPAADRLLSKTIAESKKEGRKLFALSFHVDYWNRLGWADPFSDKKYTERQEIYMTAMKTDAYTPQMIVNGTSEFVGSNESKLSNALAEAYKTKPAASFETLAASFRNGTLHVQYKLAGDYAGDEIHFAWVSLLETTSVKRGENGGRILVNENVVRQFISAKAMPSGEVDFAASPMPVKGNSAVVAYVQSGKSLKIVGAAMTMI